MVRICVWMFVGVCVCVDVYWLEFNFCNFKSLSSYHCADTSMCHVVRVSNNAGVYLMISVSCVIIQCSIIFRKKLIIVDTCLKVAVIIVC